jgi:hypothetical protein
MGIAEIVDEWIFQQEFAGLMGGVFGSKMEITGDESP